MNEDRIAKMDQKFEAGFDRLESLMKSDVTVERSRAQAGPTTEHNYVEHSFGGVPIPKAPVREHNLGDMSGLVVTEMEETEDLLISS